MLCPPIKAQKEIATTLGVLDDRITLLRETNATLEAIAQALFKSWFVDFDPVHAKAQGRQPEGMDEQTAALFPDRFVESELGMVPLGWEVEFLTDVFDFKEGPGIRNWQYTNSYEGTKFINIRCIQDSDLSLATANRITNEEANGKYLHFHLEEWDVVVSTSGTLGRSAIVRKEHLPLMLNTSVIRFRPIAEKVGFCFLYEYLNFPEFLYKLESMASGSVQKNFVPMHLKQIKLVCAPLSVISSFEAICHPLFEKVIQNRARIDNIVSLRDTLLPRLISGQLRLPDVEA
jgi:type I restriction enzyme S subunit